MHARQKQWAPDAEQSFVFLSSDASLQSGRDYQMSLEDSVPRQYAHLVAWLQHTDAISLVQRLCSLGVQYFAANC